MHLLFRSGQVRLVMHLLVRSGQISDASSGQVRSGQVSEAFSGQVRSGWVTSTQVRSVMHPRALKQTDSLPNGWADQQSERWINSRGISGCFQNR